MKKTQLLSVVFSLIMIASISAGNSIYAESDEKHDNIKERLVNICMSNDAQKEQFFLDHLRIAQFKDKIASICDLSEDERKATSPILEFNQNNCNHEYSKNGSISCRKCDHISLLKN